MSHNGLHRAVGRQKAFLRLWLTPGLGLRGCHQVLALIKKPDDLAAANLKDLSRLPLRPDVAEDLLSDRSLERAEAEWQRARTSGIRIIDLMDPDYPALLVEIYDPPLVLYLRGEVWDARRPHLAIVGTRRPSPYGLNCAEQLAADLAARGIVIVSGMARGIDAAAHRGALKEGSTVAVLGTGLDRTYPLENQQLADLAAKNGALVSEFPLGTPPLRHNFPQRNRILAGMTLGTVVVEAADRSGSLITARFALDANREVFAIPGSADSSNSSGPHKLIRQGACLVTSWEHVIEEFPEEVRNRLTFPNPTAEMEHELTEKEQAVLRSLSSSEDRSIDKLLQTLQLAPPEIYSAILELELRGLVRQLPGDRYVLAPKRSLLS